MFTSHFAAAEPFPAGGKVQVMNEAGAQVTAELGKDLETSDVSVQMSRWCRETETPISHLPVCFCAVRKIK